MELPRAMSKAPISRGYRTISKSNEYPKVTKIILKKKSKVGVLSLS